MLEVEWHPNGGKLYPVMEGPYAIMKQVSPVNFEINRSTDVVHMSKLRRYCAHSFFRVPGKGGGGCNVGDVKGLDNVKRKTKKRSLL